jgi:four helix bundle protein
MANKLEELPIYPKVVAFWNAVNATLEGPKLRRNSDAYEQISRANDSIPSNMIEGFEQGTDRAFANYLTYSKGSLAEVLKRLKKAYFKRLITADELKPHIEAGEELARMLGGFIKYLRDCDWKDRGSRRDRNQPPGATTNGAQGRANAPDDRDVDDAPESPIQ